jgi:hypothetical protein
VAPRAANHGAAVSAAAHLCDDGGEAGNHGQCVSAVARDHDQDGTPDHGPGSPGHDDHGPSADHGPDAEHGPSAAANGRGHG